MEIDESWKEQKMYMGIIFEGTWKEIKEIKTLLEQDVNEDMVAYITYRPYPLSIIHHTTH